MKEQDSGVFHDRGDSSRTISFPLIFLFCSVFPPHMICFPCLYYALATSSLSSNWQGIFSLLLFPGSPQIPLPLHFSTLWAVLLSASRQAHITLPHQCFQPMTLKVQGSRWHPWSLRLRLAHTTLLHGRTGEKQKPTKWVREVGEVSRGRA